MLEKSDLPLIKELIIGGMEFKEIAEKWERTTHAVDSFLERNETSKRQILAEYRLPIIRQALIDKERLSVTAKKLGITPGHLCGYRMKLLSDTELI